MKLIIMDFDGVIADSLELQVRSVNKFSEKYRYQKIHSKEMFKDYSMREVIKKIKIPTIHLFTVVKKVKGESSKHYDEVKLFKGIKPVLIKLRKKYCLAILSSNEEKTIKLFLGKNNLNGIFSAVYTGKKLFDKHLIMKRILKDFKVSKEDAIFIGDEQRDVEAGKKSGIKTGAVTWGYNSKERLMKENPDMLFEKPAELLRLL
jgi:phosphoglycolate phosphatase